MKKFVEKDVTENPLYHDTWKLLKKYRDVVWSLEISVQHVRAKFEIEYGTSIEEFLDSVYLAGADLNGSNIEHHAKCIERSHKMLKLLDSAVELLRTRHKNGEAYYWLLYYSFLSPQQLKNVEEIIENLRPHIRDISFRTYYRKRREAIDALSSVLWGYTSKDSLDVLCLLYTSDYSFESLSILGTCREAVEDNLTLLEEAGFSIEYTENDYQVISDKKGLMFILGQIISNLSLIHI